MLNSLIGLHEPGGESLFSQEDKGWITFTHELGHDPNDKGGYDYSLYSRQGYGCIARLNNGYGSAGTIPTIFHYANFAQRCANWVAASQGCFIYIIGNEPNLSVERPGGTSITWQNYLDCFLLCYDKIKAVASNVLVLPAAIGPWNVETGDWLQYQRKIVGELHSRGKLDGGAIHAYTHDYDVREISVDDVRHGWQWEFRTYEDQAASFPPGFPLYITECNPVSGWGDRDIGYVVGIYRQLSKWNEQHPDQKFYCCCLYRWPMIHDQPQWAISTRQNVIQDLKNAVAIGFPFDENEEPSPSPEPPDNGGDIPMAWETVYFNGFEDGNFVEGVIPKKIPAKHNVVWDQTKPRPEFDSKEAPQPEIYEGKFSAVGFHVYTDFKWWCYTDPIQVTAGKRTIGSAALMVVSHGIGGDVTKPGACGMRVGLGDGAITDPADDEIVWSDWWVVRGTLDNERKWSFKPTPELVPATNSVRLWIQCNADVAADISAGHWDNERIEQYLGDTPPPGGDVDYDLIRQIVKDEIVDILHQVGDALKDFGEALLS